MLERFSLYSYAIDDKEKNFYQSWMPQDKRFFFGQGYVLRSRAACFIKISSSFLDPLGFSENLYALFSSWKTLLIILGIFFSSLVLRQILMNCPFTWKKILRNHLLSYTNYFSRLSTSFVKRTFTSSIFLWVNNSNSSGGRFFDLTKTKTGFSIKLSCFFNFTYNSWTKGVFLFALLLCFH